MANKPYFFSSNELNTYYYEKHCDFSLHNGFAAIQKRKAIKSMHNVIHELFPEAKILDVSRKSDSPIGRALSSNSLLYKAKNGRKYPVENIYHASKLFENGGPYFDLLEMSPMSAIRDQRLKNSGNLEGYVFEGETYQASLKGEFFDLLCIKALSQNKELVKAAIEFDIFTDIEFNPKKDYHCQARAIAIFASLYKRQELDNYLNDYQRFMSIYDN